MYMSYWIVERVCLHIGNPEINFWIFIKVLLHYSWRFSHLIRNDACDIWTQSCAILGRTTLIQGTTLVSMALLTLMPLGRERRSNDRGLGLRVITNYTFDISRFPRRLWKNIKKNKAKKLISWSFPRNKLHPSSLGHHWAPCLMPGPSPS
jgi:hypothetical protein